MSEDHRHPPALEPQGDEWECSACASKVSRDAAYLGQLECMACDWRAVVWIACSRVCADRILNDLPAARPMGSA